jgi:hypothetical protein
MIVGLYKTIELYKEVMWNDEPQECNDRYDKEEASPVATTGGHATKKPNDS